VGRPIKHVVSFSGGKDSTALLLLALDRCPPGSVEVIFCDTGNEHQITYDYLDYIEQALGVQINRLRADFSAEFARKRRFIARDQRTRRDDKGRKVRWSNKAKRRALAILHPTGNPFLDLCLIKGRFPSRTVQFCTERLKRDPAVQFQLGLIDDGYQVVSWQGVRRDESHNRRNAKKAERLAPSMHAFRPLVDWTAMDCVNFVTSKGVVLNPLYKQGMGRVGCMPCINVGKVELRETAQRFPDHIQRIAEWERMVSAGSKRGFSTFGCESADEQDRRIIFDRLRIESRVEWAKTTRGGQQYDLLGSVESPACSSAYGLCE
jgi:3'-phosphoadenosine 5'-phosphosulfate sulfotransferase (PAPS reductase)/FAD synthetase